MTPKISVIITTYNAEKTIKRLLDSIFCQIGLNELFTLEVFVADDCSKDQTIQLISNYPLILVQNDQNSGGPNQGRNKCLKVASGDFITIVDHDDEWLPNRIFACLPYLEKVPVVTAGHFLHDTARKEPAFRARKCPGGSLYFKTNETFIASLTKSIHGQNSYMGSILYHHSLKNILFEEETGALDFDWTVKIFYQNDSIEVCDALYNRFVDGQNLSYRKEYRMKDFAFTRRVIESYRNEFPDEVKLGLKRLNGSIGRFHYLLGELSEARYFLVRSPINLKTIAYLLTSFCCSRWIVKKFHIFG